jgi:uncharacterized protein (DUF1501 family)
MNRRRFLVLAAAGGLVASGGAATALSGSRSSSPARRSTARFRTEPGATPAALRDRVLVVLEMAGGNDGLSMVVPYSDPLYSKLRTRTAIDPASVIPITNELGLHPNLPRLAGRGPVVIPGVGVRRPDLSHFEMFRRWWMADPDGTADLQTGFLGRLCDVIGDTDAPAVGVSLGVGPSPALAAERVTTLSVDPAQGIGAALPGDGGSLDRAWVAARRAMAHPDRADAVPTSAARAGMASAIRFGDLAAKLPPAGGNYPTSDTAAQLALAARLLAAEQGVRVIHVPLTGDFDNHTSLPSRYPALMNDLDGALEAFCSDLESRGLADRVLIATTSEFGRRPEDNGDRGVDHGTASAVFLLGPVVPGVHGEQPRLDRLDDDGNLKATVDLTAYYATIAESWFGVPAGDVLPGRPAAIGGVLQTARAA